MPLSPPSVKDWAPRYDIQPADLNTYLRDAVNFLAAPPKLRVAQNAVQTGITTGAWTVITMQSVIKDDYSGWRTTPTNHYVAQVPGWHTVTLLMCAAVPLTNMARVGLQYQINGTVIGPYEFNQAESGGSPWTWDAFDEVYLGAGDSVWPMFFQSSGATISSSLSSPPTFEVTWWSK